MLEYKTHSSIDDISNTETIDFNEMTSPSFPENKDIMKNVDFSEYIFYPIIGYLFDILSTGKSNKKTEDFIKNIFNLGYLTNRIESAFKPEEIVNELSIIQTEFTLRNENVVFDYLIENPFLIPIIYEAKNKIETLFPSSEIILEVFRDPEETDVQDLFVIIKTDFSMDIAFKKIDTLERTWLFNNQYETNYKLFIDVEFK